MKSSGFTRRQTFKALLAASATALPFPSFATKDKRGGTLVIGFIQSPRHLNGVVQAGIGTSLPGSQLFASPIRFDENWEPQPYLAKSWDLSEDGKTLTLNLRNDAVFHDGHPITSADIAFTIMALKEHNPFRIMESVNTVETPDAHTAIIHMNTPNPAILQGMSPPFCPVLPKHIYDDGQDLKTHPRNSENVVGSGPYKLVDFARGRQIVMERFDKYFMPGQPYLDKLIFNINPDAMNLLLGLERGEIQMVPFITSPTHLKRLEANPQAVATNKGYEGLGALSWIMFNTVKKPLNDIRVRKAIANSLDKGFITKVLMSGYAISADGPIIESSPFATDDLVRYSLDLKKAAEILDTAGYEPDENGQRFTLSMDYEPGAGDLKKMVAEYIRAQLKKIGIGVQVRASADFPSWAARMASHDFDMSIDSVYNWADPVIGVNRTYLSSNIKPMVWANNASYSNSRVDELLEKAGHTRDPIERKKYYAEFQKIVTDELPNVFINIIPYHTVVRKNVVNVPTTVLGPLSPYDEIYLQ